mmetsp:Transcript_19996/g.59838  ORF Transcript_19996/g.59838 Transcript_19996/m.59838 type:complete len:162 (-) Transcript_19996:74-559(-)
MAAEDCAALAGAAAACAMSMTSVLAVLDLAYQASVLRGAAESVTLLVGGLACLQGETRLFYNYHEVVQDNFGFALKPLGRGGAYLLAGLYCAGARAAAVGEEAAAAGSGGRSSFFGLLWYACCLIMLAGGVSSLWSWRGARRTIALAGEGVSDLDAYYISS